MQNTCGDRSHMWPCRFLQPLFTWLQRCRGWRGNQGRAPTKIRRGQVGRSRALAHGPQVQIRGTSFSALRFEPREGFLVMSYDWRLLRWFFNSVLSLGTYYLGALPDTAHYEAERRPKNSGWYDGHKNRVTFCLIWRPCQI